jgi:hydrogenase large subunit
MLVAYARGHEGAMALIDGALAQLGAPVTALLSALGRHAARALEAKLVADAMADWVLQLKPGEPVCAEYELPDEAEGMGLTEAARGALGHWVSVKDKRIASYQCVVPTTWNASPRDDRGQPGPIEQALQGTKVRDEENPFELVRIVRSFDPCIACAVHLVTPKGRSLGEFRVF